jgi:hypothetical protein
VTDLFDSPFRQEFVDGPLVLAEWRSLPNEEISRALLKLTDDVVKPLWLLAVKYKAEKFEDCIHLGKREEGVKECNTKQHKSCIQRRPLLIPLVSFSALHRFHSLFWRRPTQLLKQFPLTLVQRDGDEKHTYKSSLGTNYFTPFS